ncbi:MAG: OmpA family protein [Desulfobacterales bacterium]|nr:MAG: OmpA family protein [Desulfobacterales bacterium]
MRNKLSVAFILMLIIPGLAVVSACSHQTSPPAAPEVRSTEVEAASGQAEQQQSAQPAEIEAERLRKEATEMEFMHEAIYFAKGSYFLPPEAQEILRRKAQWLRDNPDISVIIEGHTDEPGTKEFNLALGDRRAGEVKSFLLREGIDSPRLNAVSYGNERPVGPGRTEEARAKNRRVQLVIE